MDRQDAHITRICTLCGTGIFPVLENVKKSGFELTTFETEENFNAASNFKL
jgi:hypothetical protein